MHTEINNQCQECNHKQVHDVCFCMVFLLVDATQRISVKSSAHVSFSLQEKQLLSTLHTFPYFNLHISVSEFCYRIML